MKVMQYQMFNINTVEDNIMQHLHKATSDSETLNSATSHTAILKFQNIE